MRVGVFGASGYAGREAVRILGRHPAPSRKLDLFALEGPNPRPLHPDLAAAEHEIPIVAATTGSKLAIFSR